MLFVLSSWVRRSLPPVTSAPGFESSCPRASWWALSRLLLQRLGIPSFAGPLAGAILGSLAIVVAVRARRARENVSRFDADAVV